MHLLPAQRRQQGGQFSKRPPNLVQQLEITYNQDTQ